MQHTTHPKVVAGVVLIASLMLFSVVFAVGLGLSWMVSPPEIEAIGSTRLDPTFADYFSTMRVTVPGIVALVVTVLFWKIAEGEMQ